MNQREKAFWRSLKRQFNADLPTFDITRVENKVASFMPDIHYSTPLAQGWVELKCAVKRADGTVDLAHFTRGQKAWLIMMGSRHDYCWMLCKIYSDRGQDTTTYFLLDHVGVKAIKEKTYVSWDEIVKVSRRIWCGGMDIGSLALALQEPQEQKMMATDKC